MQGQGHDPGFGRGFHHPVPIHHWWVGGPLLLLLLAVLIGVIVWGIVRLTRHPTVIGHHVTPAGASGPGPDAALERVRARYAAGEIDREAFLQMNADLGAPPPPPPPGPPPGG